jgi:hypothetical protein
LNNWVSKTYRPAQINFTLDLNNVLKYSSKYSAVIFKR